MGIRSDNGVNVKVRTDRAHVIQEFPDSRTVSRRQFPQ